MKRVRGLSLLIQSIKNPLYVTLLVICFSTYKLSLSAETLRYRRVLTSDIVNTDSVSEHSKARSHPVKRILVAACDEVIFTALYLKLGSNLTEQAIERGRGLCGVIVVVGRGGAVRVCLHT